MIGKSSFDLIVLTESHFVPGVCSRLTKCDLVLEEIHRPLGTNRHGNRVFWVPLKSLIRKLVYSVTSS